jgi:DNA-binding MarR family transcriptional regulator
MLLGGIVKKQHRYDIIDTIIDDWKRELPDLDPSGMAIAGRIVVAAAMIQRGVDRVLERSGLSQWAFDVLATLRRKGEPYQLSPTELAHSTMLSSAAMVNRLDRLESRGLIKRLPNPVDRRGIIVQLTSLGKSSIEQALPERFAEAQRIAAILSVTEQKELGRLLRCITTALA